MNENENKNELNPASADEPVAASETQPAGEPAVPAPEQTAEPVPASKVAPVAVPAGNEQPVKSAETFSNPSVPPTFNPAVPPTFGNTAQPTFGNTAQPTPNMGPGYMPPVGAPPMGARPVPPPPPATAYRWSYADQKVHDTTADKRHRSRGIRLYALVMVGVFALSFGLLLGVMLMKGGEFPTIQFSEPVTDENGQIIPTTDYADAVNIEKAKHSVVLIEVITPNGGGSGTGIILSEDGYIATNHHVIENGTSIRVKFYDGTYATATLRGSSEVDDLAVIKVDRSNLAVATFAKSADCFVGQTVYAIGNPSGAEMAWTTTKGCISYLDRELKIYHDDGTLEKKLKMIQTDAMVNPGNSGGPLVNANGEVVGIVSMKLADGYEGIGFAIPSDGAAEILNAIIKDGNADNVNSNVSYDRPIIGITGVYLEAGKHYVFEEKRVVEVSDSYAEENPDEVVSPAVSGMYVRTLTEGTDAAIKLAEGDIITAINGVEVTNKNMFMNEVNKHYAGDDVTITYYRNGLYSEITITLSAANG